MTVKCLAPAQQHAIVTAFVEFRVPIDTLAIDYGKSRRTIIRVLEDHCVDPGIRRRPGAKKPIPTTAQAELSYAEQIKAEDYPLPVGDPIFTPKQGFFNRMVDKLVRGLSFS